MKSKLLLITSLIFAFLVSCKKDEDTIYKPIDTGELKIALGYHIDNKNLVYDTLQYQNAAGNKYSVTRVFYYISNLRLYKSDNSSNPIQSVTYVDAAKNNSEIRISGIPVGDYNAISFSIGLDTAYNKSNALPETVDNINMAWPDEMGGGYHFLKLEGHYLNASNQEKGYTVHLGTNAALVNHNKLIANIAITKNQTTSIGLKMNINEWFTGPYNYNFNTDGNYTMGDVILMQKIMNNGKDVFTIY